MLGKPIIGRLRKVARDLEHPGRIPTMERLTPTAGGNDGPVLSRDDVAPPPSNDQTPPPDVAFPREVARLSLPTPFGQFELRGFESATGFVHLALVKGRIGKGRSVLTRLHSECLTGDALGSLRCDCGVQLRMGLRAVAAEGRGVVIYTTGHEGRGIGLVNKLRAYVLQEEGADTVEANHRLGFLADSRDYREAARVLTLLGVRSIRLLTNNPEKTRAARSAGLLVEEVVPLPVAPHIRNVRYLETKRRRLGQDGLAASPLRRAATASVPDVSALLGPVIDPGWRPFVIVKFAQTLDGRIATSGGDSKWISGESERAISHGLRAACDAVLVGAGTVIADDPQLTVRMVPGSSPLRVVLDSTLRIPLDARLLDGDAATIVLTTDRAPRERGAALAERGVAIRRVQAGPGGVDVAAALRTLRAAGIRSLLVEGGSRVITSMLAAGVVDRVIVGIAPSILGSGTEAVGDLGSIHMGDALRLTNRSVHAAGDDLLLAGDVVPSAAAAETPAS